MAGMENYPPMVRSTTDRLTTVRPQITKADIGKRVLVGGAKHGTLRYVGKVIDKDGMFCGIELDVPEGKHNGAFGDVIYFNCRPKFGIFAPLYKVELEPDTCTFDAKHEARAKLKKAEQEMVKSSMPAIEGDDEQLKDIYPHLEASVMMPNWTNSTSQFDSMEENNLDGSMSFKENLNIPRRMSSHGDSADLFSITPPEGFFEENNESSLGPDATMAFLSISQTIENPKIPRSEQPVIESDQETEEEEEDHCSGSRSLQFPEAEDDVQTPLAEVAPATTQSPTETHESQNRSVSSSLSVDTGYQGDTDCSTYAGDAHLALSPPASQDNATTGAPSADHGHTTTTPTANAAHQSLPAETAPSATKKRTVNDPTAVNTKRSKENLSTTASKAGGTSPGAKEASSSQSSQQQSASKRQNQKVKEAVPLQSPAVKAAARPPKGPSKSQQMMEQIKASIEAEKNKPKREAKSKLAEIIAAPTPVTKPPGDENKGPEGEEMPVPATPPSTTTTATTTGSAPKRTKLTPLLAKNLPPAPPRNPPKPRQSLLPPPRTAPTVTALAATSTNVASSFAKANSERPTSRPSKLPEPRSRNGSISSSTSTAAPTTTRPGRPTSSVSPRPPAVKSANATTANERKRQPSGTSSSAMPSASSSTAVSRRPAAPSSDAKASTSNGTATPSAPSSGYALRPRAAPKSKSPAAVPSNASSGELKRLQEEMKMGQKRLAHAVKGFSALAVVAEHSRNRMAMLDTQRHESERRLRQNIDDLAAKIDSLTSERTQLCELHTRSLESLHTKHADEVKRVTGQHEQELERVHKVSQHEKEQLRRDAQEALEKALADTQALHNQAVDAMSRQHQQQCSLLDDKLADAEKMIVQLKKDKTMLETTLAKDRDEKVKTLTAEVSSLNTALELRSAEIRELRQKNSKLELEVEIIPALENEKKKLELRVEDLQQIIENRKNTEKLLASRCEELQRSANKKAEMSQSVLMENDMLRYRLEEMETSASESEGGSMLSSTMWYTPQMSTSHNSTKTLPVSAGRRSRSSHSNSIDVAAKDGAPSGQPPGAAPSHNAALMTRSMEGDEVLAQSVMSVYKQQGRDRRSRMLDGDTTICTPEGTYHASELDSTPINGHRPPRTKARLSFDENDASSSARSPTKGVADSGIFSSIHSQRATDNDDETSS